MFHCLANFCSIYVGIKLKITIVLFISDLLLLLTWLRIFQEHLTWASAELPPWNDTLKISFMIAHPVIAHETVWTSTLALLLHYLVNHFIIYTPPQKKPLYTDNFLTNCVQNKHICNFTTGSVLNQFRFDLCSFLVMPRYIKNIYMNNNWSGHLPFQSFHF